MNSRRKDRIHMAIISKVSAQKRPGRYNIFLDGKYAFSVAEKTLTQYVLLQGKELTADQIAAIQKFDADAKASNLAARYLSYEPRTVYELLNYLKKHEVSMEAANSAVSEFNELGYLDDKEYCKLFIKNNWRVGKSGPRDLARKLKQKGVAPDLISEMLEQVPGSQWLVVGSRVIKTMPHQLGRYSLSEVKRKMQQKLLAHGFDNDQIQQIVAASDLKEDSDKEKQVLKKQGLKAYRRYRNLNASQRKFKVKRFLYQHGFSAGEIDSFLNGEIVDLDTSDEV